MMRREVRKDLSASAIAFRQCVWPKVKAWCREGEIYLAEDPAIEGDPVLQFCDQYSGIDAWQILHKNRRVRGIASRVQFGRAFKSLTIRFRRTTGAETEFAKRLFELKNPANGYVTPGLTIQAYCTQRPSRGQSELLHAVMVRTSDLYDYIENNPRAVDTRTNPSDGNIFKVVWWPHMKELGYKVRAYEDPFHQIMYGGPPLNYSKRR